METMSAWKVEQTNGAVMRRSEESNSSKATHCWGILIGNLHFKYCLQYRNSTT
jgi:hypothetical protein